MCNYKRMKDEEQDAAEERVRRKNLKIEGEVGETETRRKGVTTSSTYTHLSLC
jgi:hypothetical protein